MRTLNNIHENLKPIDKVLEEQFLPALFGRQLTNQDRELLALPVKAGGLDIHRINENTSSHYVRSVEEDHIPTYSTDRFTIRHTTLRSGGTQSPFGNNEKSTRGPATTH